MFTLARAARVCARTSGAATLRTSAASLGLLKGIHPALTPDLLWVLRAAGHGEVKDHLSFRPPAFLTSRGFDRRTLLRANAALSLIV